MTIEFPLMVLSYNRPSYLEAVLVSLRSQRRPVDPSRLYLFQDLDEANPSLSKECIEVFSRIFPDATKIIARRNLGVGLNYDRAERFAFEILRADVGYFFEDDLLLSPHYLEMLDAMAELALADPRIAYASAYGDHLLSLAAQEARCSEIGPLHAKWGFALTRRQWLRQKSFIDGYLDLIRHDKYKDRNNKAIRAYFSACGFSSPGTSQDSAKDVASALLGTCKINTIACYAKYIGATGIHYDPKSYERDKFGSTVMMPWPRRLVAPPSEQVTKWVNHNSDEAKVHLRAQSAELNRSDIENQSGRIVGSESIGCHQIDIGMIVKNEEAILPRTLDALLNVGFNSFVILDMESDDRTKSIIYQKLGSKVKLIDYPRKALVENGFAEARNVCATFSTREWLLFVDADEILKGGVEDGYVSIKKKGKNKNLFFVQRENLVFDKQGEPIDVRSSERHLRLYRPSFTLRWDGYIHEEIFCDGRYGSEDAGESGLSFDHYSDLKVNSPTDQKDSLYAYMLMRAFEQPALQRGTNRYWYDKFVPENKDWLAEKAPLFDVRRSAR